jgi:hypothetical protein
MVIVRSCLTSHLGEFRSAVERLPAVAGLTHCRRGSNGVPLPRNSALGRGMLFPTRVRRRNRPRGGLQARFAVLEARTSTTLRGPPAH